MLTFENLQRQYRLGGQRVNALCGVSGQIERGEMVALCGPSGSGKSTLLNILGLLDMAYDGSVVLDGEVMPKAGRLVQQRQAATLRRSKMGFIFQRFNLIPVMTALENVCFPLMLNGMDLHTQIRLATEMLEAVGLAEFIHHRPDHLSGGQQQRVAVARALVHSPSLVIADEPTASLDSQSAGKIIALMKALGHRQGTTFVIATHDPRMARQCDRVMTLCDGQISEEGMSWAS